MDDTHTYHLSYIVFHAPGIEAPEQEGVSYFDAPMFDDEGRPVLDYTLAQDMAAWWSQGPRTDRSKEQLGATDLAIIEFRKIIEEQIALVERGEQPMNVFFDRDEIGEMIEFEPRLAARTATGEAAVALFRANYSSDYYNDDVDRYSPSIPLAQELIRRVAEAADQR